MLQTRVLLLLFAASAARAQSTPQELASATVQNWVAAAKNRAAGLAVPVRNGTKLLLSGVQLTGNSGDDTILGMEFSGVYDVGQEGAERKLGRHIPLEELGQISGQRLRVRIRPGHGIDVEDAMRVRANTAAGFAARLNHRAKLRSVRVGNGAVDYRFGGGLLWLDLPPGESRLTLEYAIDVETAPEDTNSGCFREEYGHVRNQYLWHPFFGFDTTGDLARLEIEAHIPKEYRVATGVPQSERIAGEERIVEGKTAQPSFALSLAYDRGWNVESRQTGQVRLDLYLASGFQPGPDEISSEARQIFELFAGRFGKPASDYFSVVQLRARSGNGYFASNQGIFVSGVPGSFSSNSGRIQAYLGHEISHLWTQGSGPAANFLREGWATYAESLVVEQEFPRNSLVRFWRQEAREYFAGYDGKIAMWGSGNESNLNYCKGGWLFRMLEAAVGKEAFNRAMAEFSRSSLAGKSDFDTLVDCFRTAEFDAAQFLSPWMKEKRAPSVTAAIDGNTVTVRQDGTDFLLPVTLGSGGERHRVWLRGEPVKVHFSGAISDVRIDPDEELLLKR